MILRAVVSMILAAGLLGFGLIVWVATRMPTPAKPTVQTVSILTAAHELHPGTLLKPDDIVPKKLTTGEIPKGATVATPDQQRQLTGAMVRHALAQGDAILNADVLRRVITASSPPCSSPACAPSPSGWISSREPRV